MHLAGTGIVPQNTLRRGRMCWHKWSKWEQYQETVYFFKYKEEVIEDWQKRHCIKCMYEQRERI